MENVNRPIAQALSFSDASGRPRQGWRLALGTLTVVLGLFLATLAGELTARWHGELPWLARQFIQAVVMIAVVLPLICWLRLKLDRRSLAGIGLAEPKRALRFFLLGLSIPAAILLLPLLIIVLGGWASVTVNSSAPLIGLLLGWLIVALLFEALPEEIAIRGYLYRNLSSAMVRWLAALASIGLFVCIPLALALVQWLTGVGGDFGGAAGITADYLIIIVLFGAVLAYLRVATGSVWTCVGFHLGFLQLGRQAWVGDHDQTLFQIEATNAGPVDLAYQLAVLAGLLLILGLPWLCRHQPGWNRRARD